MPFHFKNVFLVIFGMNPVRMFTAVKAFIEFNGKVLLLRESKHYADGANAGKFYVPGGRVEPGEFFLDSLRREVAEECGLEIEIGKPFFVGEWRPVVKGEQWQIIGAFFLCKAKTDEVKLSSDQDRFIWINPRDYAKFSIMKPEDEAFLEYLQLKR